MLFLKNIKNFLYSGLEDDTSIDIIRYHVTINSLCISGLCFLVYFAIQRYSEGNMAIAFADITMAAILFSTIIFLRVTNNYKTSGLIVCVLIALFFTFLFVNGSSEDTGASWGFLLPLFVCSTVGKKMGAIITTTFLILNLSMATIFSFTPVYKANYSTEFIIVHFSVLFLASILAYIVESVRDATQNKLIATITEKEKLNEALLQSQKLEAIGQLAGGIAHDINNMMCVVSGYSELIKKKMVEIDPLHEGYADSIHKTAQRTADLTNKLLAFARKGKYEVHNIDINSIVIETATILKRTINPKITIIEKLYPRQCWILGDRGQVHNAILNLCLNARDAMPDGGTLTISTNITNSDIPSDIVSITDKIRYMPKEWVVCTIEDTGTGMDDNTKARLFEPFFTTKERGKGTGLGLASAYGTMKAHSGAITVKSQKGVGSQFMLYFPLTEVTAEPVQSEKRASHAKNGSVLIIDDEMAIRELLIEMLTGRGFNCHACGTGSEAIKYYEANKCNTDLILLDIIMPDIDGKDCYEQLKKIGGDPRVIVMSGYSIDGVAQEMLDNGASAFIQKPFTEENLLDAIDKTMII